MKHFNPGSSFNRRRRQFSRSLVKIDLEWAPVSSSGFTEKFAESSKAQKNVESLIDVGSIGAKLFARNIKDSIKIWAKRKVFSFFFTLKKVEYVWVRCM
jgi:hypothetical protein